MSLHANPLAAPLKTLGITLDAKQTLMLQLAVVAVPVLIAGGAAAYVWAKKRKSQPAPAVGGGGDVGAPIDPAQLRRAWGRFTGGLPAGFRRSILNFEHFVVLGAAASGKSRLIDGYTDWRRQAKQLEASQSHDPELPVYLASGVVVTELPARYLTDHGAKCQAALRNLWRPIYARRAPTVVLTVDVRRLLESTPEALVELAESARAKVDVLSRVRGRAVEVRVVLTHLDTVEGFAKLAAFCAQQRIGLRVPVRVGPAGGESTGRAEQGGRGESGDASPVTAQLEAWLEAMLEHLPRALTRVSAGDHLEIVSFLRRAPELFPPLARLVDALFVHDALSIDPVCGGVFLASDPPGEANPLVRAAEQGPGPDPRRVHLLVTAAAASACVAYMLAAFQHQRSAHAAAEAALVAGSVADPSDGLERRRQVSEFTQRSTGVLDTRPDYVGGARAALRKRYSERLRDEVLVPNLRVVAERGRLDEASLRMPTRRSLYYLALLHSDHRDRMGILQGGNLNLWADMTGLPRDVIRDYVQNTDEAFRQVVSFKLNNTDGELSTTFEPWAALLRKIERALTDAVITPEQLREVQEEALRLEQTLRLYNEDRRTQELLGRVDEAAGTLVATAAGVERPLEAAYRAQFAEYIEGARRYRVRDQAEALQRVTQAVRKGAVTANSQPLLRSLIEQLEVLYGGATGAAGQREKISLDGHTYEFESTRWALTLRNSTGRELIGRFLAAAATGPSIFFPQGELPDLPRVRWNAVEAGSGPMFAGYGELDGRYTKAAYDNYVRAVVLKLAEVLDRAKLPDERRRELEDFVERQVRTYATAYKGQLVTFVSGFRLSRQGAVSLRATIDLMSRDGPSTFNDYLQAVELNSRLEVDEKSRVLAPMADVVNEFRVWRAVVGPEAKGADMAKYRATLAQLLVDLGPAEGAAAEQAAGPDTLEKRLAPAGRLALAEIKGGQGSYRQVVNDWLTNTRLPEYQRRPFAEPLAWLSEVGVANLQDTLAQAWETEALPDLRKIAARFPLDPTAREDASPAEVTAMFHPQTGKFFDVFRRFFEPVSEFSDGGPFRPKAALRRRVPPHLYDVTNAVALLSSRLWDASGKPVPMTVNVATVPFEHGKNPKLALTLVFMNVGATSIFNFNQQATKTPVLLDWTKETTAQVGLQLTDVETKDSVYATPKATASSFWSLWRLEKMADAADAVKSPPGAQLFSWKITADRREGNVDGLAQFVVYEDIWAPFAVGAYVRSRLSARASK